MLVSVAMSQRTRAALLAGEVVRGEFAPGKSDLATPGTLAWSAESGADLVLIGDTAGWPGDLGKYRHAVQGVIDGRDAVTILHAGVRQISAFGRTSALRATTLALGEHIDEATRWSRAIYETTNLSEWIAASGLQHVSADEPGEGASGILWEPPPRHDFQLPRADAAFIGHAEMDPVGYMSSWSVVTSQRLVVDVRRRATMGQLHDRYAVPLVAFTAFAADRPDSVIVEILRNPDERRRVEVWRQGRRYDPREWNPASGYLFRASDLPRLPAAVRRWWGLHAAAWPALGMFAEHITDGNTYSPARFLTLHTAMEAYCRVRFGKKDFRLMRDYANVDVNAHGCTNKALALIGASRNYFSHLSRQNVSHEATSDTLLHTTRRAHALLQACLLREMGFGPRQTERLLSRHHAGWPLPSVIGS